MKCPRCKDNELVSKFDIKRKICPRCVLSDAIKRKEKLDKDKNTEIVWSEDTERVWAMINRNGGKFVLCENIGPLNNKCCLNEGHNGPCAGYIEWCNKF